MLPTSKLAKHYNVNVKRMYQDLVKWGFVVKEEDNWALTPEGEKTGAIYKNYFGRYIAWPDDFIIELDKKYNLSESNETSKGIGQKENDNSKNEHEDSVIVSDDINNRIFPRLEHINPKSNYRKRFSEQHYNLAKHLNDQKILDKEWLIYINPNINYSLRPDCILLHPMKGMVVIKIKNWTKEYFNKTKLDVETSNGNNKKRFLNGKKRIPKPGSGIEQIRNQIINEIKPLNEFFQEKKNTDGFNKSKKFCAARVCYFFPKLDYDTNKIIDKFKELELKDKFLFLSKDDINKKLSLDNKINEHDNNKNYNSKDFDFYWSKILPTQIKTFLTPSYHKIEHGTYIQFSQQQEKLLKPFTGKTQVIEGVAGSGKSLLIGEKAAQMASKDKNVLVLCYNITLRQHLKEQINRSMHGFWPDLITVTHFHGHLRTLEDHYLLKEFRDGPELQDEDGEDNYFNEKRPRSVIEFLERYPKRHTHENFDAIYIDEGQDFSETMLELIQFLKHDETETFIVHDKKQNLFEQNSNLIDNYSKKSLSNSFRIPDIHFPVVNKFAEMFLDGEQKFPIRKGNQQILPFFNNSIIWNECTKIPKNSNKASSFNKDTCKYCKKTFKSQSDEFYCDGCEKYMLELKDSIINAINELMREGNNIDDIVLLLPYRWEIRKMSEYLKENEIDSRIVNTREDKINFSRLGHGVKISTIHSFKGYELSNVIVVTEHNNAKKFSPELIYTSITRSTNKLIILNRDDRYVDFGLYLENYKKSFESN